MRSTAANVRLGPAVETFAEPQRRMPSPLWKKLPPLQADGAKHGSDLRGSGRSTLTELLREKNTLDARIRKEKKRVADVDIDTSNGQLGTANTLSKYALKSSRTQSITAGTRHKGYKISASQLEREDGDKHFSRRGLSQYFDPASFTDLQDFECITAGCRDASPKDDKLPFDLVVTFKIPSEADGPLCLKRLCAQFKAMNQGAAPVIKHLPDEVYFSHVWETVLGNAANGETVNSQNYFLARALCVVGLIQEQASMHVSCTFNSTSGTLVALIAADWEDLSSLATNAQTNARLSPVVDKLCNDLPAYAPYLHKHRNDNIYGRYRVKTRKGETVISSFRELDRVKILHSHISNFVSLQGLVSKGWATSYRPVDREERISKIKQLSLANAPCGGHFLLSKAPIFAIRDYFGEKVALYFCWLEFYRNALLPLAVAGSICFAWSVGERSGMYGDANMPDDIGGLLFTIIVILWGSLFQQYWRRNESRRATEWGMVGIDSRQELRFDFTANVLESRCKGKLELVESIDANEPNYVWRGEPYFVVDRKARMQKLLAGLLFSLVMVAVLGGSLVGIFVLRYQLYEQIGIWSVIISGVIYTALISLLNIVYGQVARRLTAAENWAYQKDFEKSLAIKTFVFRFLNTYNSLFYIAFFKAMDVGCISGCRRAKLLRRNGPACGAFVPDDFVDLQRCSSVASVLRANNNCWPTNGIDDEESIFREYGGDCTMELMIHIALIFGSQLLIGNFREVVWPVLWRRCRFSHRMAHFQASDRKPRYETFEDYSEMVVQLGFVTIFAVAFPLGPLLALVNNLLEVRVDLQKICHLCERPIPEGVADIGIWDKLIHVTLWISIVTNAAIFSFTTDASRHWSDLVRLVVFGTLCTSGAVIRLLLTRFIPTVPRDVERLRKRHECVIESVIKKVHSSTPRIIIDGKKLDLSYETI